MDEKIGPFRLYLQELITIYLRKIEFKTLERGEQLLLISKALQDPMFDNLEILTIEKEVINLLILNQISPNEFAYYVKNKAIDDYEIYIDDKFEDEYIFLGYEEAPNVIDREPNLDRVSLSDEIFREKERCFLNYKYERGEI